MARGQLRIALLDDSYHLVPAEIVERVEQPQANVILPRPVDDTPAEDDPHADYVISDDLMWYTGRGKSTAPDAVQVPDCPLSPTPASLSLPGMRFGRSP